MEMEAERAGARFSCRSSKFARFRRLWMTSGMGLVNFFVLRRGWCTGRPEPEASRTSSDGFDFETKSAGWALAKDKPDISAAADTAPPSRSVATRRSPRMSNGKFEQVVLVD